MLSGFRNVFCFVCIFVDSSELVCRKFGSWLIGIVMVCLFLFLVFDVL